MSQKQSEEESRHTNLEEQPENQMNENISTPVEQNKSDFKEKNEKKNIEMMTAQILKLEAQLADALKRENENLLRYKAEEANIHRNAEREIEKAHKFALQKFAADLLPVIDNLERALEAVDKFDKASTPIIEGVELTLKSLLDTVSKFGIEVICETNVPLNPEIHQAITTVESDEHESNHIISIICKGYTLNGRLLRPAMVSVSKKTS